MDRFKKLHYAWKVVIACIFIKIGTGGATACCMSSFVTPIVTELGCKVSELTLYTSINAITMALLYTTAARVIGRRKIGLIMGVASCGEVLGILLMAFYREVHLFYISGALIGASQAFNGFVALPIIINMWFKKKSGMVLGTVTAIGSGASVLYGLLSGQLITSFGWRTSYLILAAMAFILTVPVVFRYIRKPDEVGVAPYGAEEPQETGEAGNASDDDGHSLTKKQAFRMPMTWIAWISCILFSGTCAAPVLPEMRAQNAQHLRTDDPAFGAHGGPAASPIVAVPIIGRFHGVLRGGVPHGSIRANGLVSHRQIKDVGLGDQRHLGDAHVEADIPLLQICHDAVGSAEAERAPPAENNGMDSLSSGQRVQ